MSHHVFHFCSSYEGTATNAEVINFSRASAEVTVTNDHDTASLSFKFDAGEDYMTVYSKESVTLRMQETSMIVDGQGTAIPYRVWTFSP